jgi:hypothetical protein
MCVCVCVCVRERERERVCVESVVASGVERCIQVRQVGLKQNQTDKKTTQGNQPARLATTQPPDNATNQITQITQKISIQLMPQMQRASSV